MKDWDSPPLVKWASRSDREKSRNHAKIKERYQALVNDTWRRIPPSGISVITGHPMWGKTIELFNRLPGCEADTRGGRYFGDNHGTYKSGIIGLNIGMDIDTRRLSTKSTIIWTFAHEFAHAYLDTFAFFAVLAPDFRKKKVDENQRRLLSSLPIGCGGVGIYMLDKGKTPFLSSMTERLADAVAIAWGFGEEYAISISRCGVESSRDVEESDGYGAYLAPEILKIHEILTKKEDQNRTGR